MVDGTGPMQRTQLSQRRACKESDNRVRARYYVGSDHTRAAHRRAFMSASVNRMRVTAGFGSSENVASRFSCSQTHATSHNLSLKQRCTYLSPIVAHKW